MSPTESSREENVYMSKLAEQVKRYEEMVEFMEKVAKTSDTYEMTVEERNLLSVTYKNVIGAKRASWRIISSIEQKEESRGNEDHVNISKDYIGKIEAELSMICDGILNLLRSHLIPYAPAAESKVFYLKIKGDYYRYLAEFKTRAERKEVVESTLVAYKCAQDIALAELDPAIRPLVEQNSKSLHHLHPEIPLWMKNPDYGQIDLLNMFLELMCPHMDKAICKTAKNIATPIYAEQIPKYKIESVEFEALTL